MMNLWVQVSQMGVKPEMRFETKRRIILLNRISVVLFLIVFTLRTVVFSLGIQEFTPTSLVAYLAVFVILFIPYVNKLGYYKINAFVFSLIVPLCFLFFSVIAQTANHVVNINHYYVPRLFILSVLVLPLVLIDARDKAFLYTAILVNLLCIVSFDAVVNLIGVPFNHETVDFSHFDKVSRIMILPAALLMAAFFFLTSLNRKYEEQITGLNTTLTNKNDELEQFNEEVTSQRDVITLKNNLLEEANAEIELANTKLTDGIIYAKNIQRAVLYEEELPNGFFQDSFIFFKPKLQVSGDFYFYKKYSINEKPCLIVAAVDCTGHGIPGGFLSMLGMTLINEILHNENINDAADILSHLRNRIKSTLNQTGELAEQKDGMEMALCIYYPETKEMDYAGAKNPLCYIDTEGEFCVIKGDRQPIGIHLKEKEFTNHHIQFKGGEMLYICSDGLQDQFGGAEGKKLKFSNLQSLFVQMSDKTCENQAQEVKSFLHNWVNYEDNNQYEQIDDMVLIGMRV